MMTKLPFIDYSYDYHKGEEDVCSGFLKWHTEVLTLCTRMGFFKDSKSARCRHTVWNWSPCIPIVSQNFENLRINEYDKGEFF